MILIMGENMAHILKSEHFEMSASTLNISELEMIRSYLTISQAICESHNVNLMVITVDAIDSADECGYEETKKIINSLIEMKKAGD